MSLSLRLECLRLAVESGASNPVDQAEQMLGWLDAKPTVITTMTALPTPIGYIENEGDYSVFWGKDRRPSRVHAVTFDNGMVFDTYNGWHPKNG